MDQQDEDESTQPAVVEVPEIREKPKTRRGFASMDPEKVKAIAALGGRRAHEVGTAHRFDSEKAREAGRKGGNAPHASRGRRPGT